MQLHLKIVNQELARRGYTARLDKGDGYFYFHFGEAADWLDRTVRVRKINDLTLKEWIAEFQRLRELNGRIMGSIHGGGAERRKPRGSGKTAS